MNQSIPRLFSELIALPPRRAGVIVSVFVAGALTSFSCFGDPPRFDRDIWPILVERCIKCHGESEHEGDLRLDSPDSILKGGEYGPIITQGDPEKSTLFELISLPENDSDRMPKKGDSLSPEQVERIRAWISAGASFEGWSPAMQAAANEAVAATEQSALSAVPEAHELPQARLEFNRDIRPILSNKCFPCHGPDAGARQANLRLDQAESAYADRGPGTTGQAKRFAIVPGDLKRSEIAKRLFHPDVEERMPPKDSSRQPTEEERRILAAWVAQGAEYEAHWSFIPPKRQQPPAAAGMTHPIDRFVGEKLAEQGLESSPPADPVTLVRRLSLDLVGLPPAPELVDAFAASPTNEAYVKLVDHFLASPHYGERMAVNWLDQVRYADSNGYHSDEFREMSAYRDYVIKAFNTNKPYDEFTIEQLAGDLIPGATRDQLVASGFNRLNQITAEGGAQAKEYRAKYNADRVRAYASVWMGATMGCAECHDHKFDPYTQKDFYSLAAFFADIDELDVYAGRTPWAPLLPLPTLRELWKQSSFDFRVAEFEEMLRTPTQPLARGEAKWIRKIAEAREANDAGWMLSKPESFESKGGATLTLLDDLSILSTGTLPFKEVYSVVLPTDRRTITALRIEAMNHSSFTGAVTRTRRNFYVNELEIEVIEAGKESALPVRIASAESSVGEAGRAIDGKFSSVWTAAVNAKDKIPTVKGLFKLEKPIEGGPGTRIVVRIHHLGGAMFDRSAFGRFRFSLTTAEEPGLDAPGIIPEFALAAALKKGNLNPDEKDWMSRYYRTVAPELDQEREKFDELLRERRAFRDEMRTTLVSRSIPPREVRILARGNWQDDSGEIVGPDVPESLFPLDVAGRRANRMDLAKWTVAEENPLTARVFMNRLWKLFFGRGLSGVLDDLGSQGEWPTHPELFDWLAAEFVESGWDVKHMVRLIVTSETYRQASDADASLLEADPKNLWLARQSAIRLEAEFIRDMALSLSGLLNPEVGGRSVRPYQPKDYWENLNFPERVYKHDTGDKQYRRGVYSHWQRSFLHPSLYAFDAPSREECVAQRPISNTPLQALVLLNDPTYVEAARKFAERIMIEGGDEVGDRVRWAFKQAVSRTPTGEEARLLEDLFSRHLALFSEDLPAAEQVMETGLSEVAPGLKKTELAAWTSVARVILNLHETITRS